MPIYEYECEKCNVTFEAMQSISAKPLKTCKGLGCNDKDNGKVNRLISASGFIFKGSGWFTSEYPSEARKKGWESESQQTTTATNASGKAAGDKASASESKEPATEKPAAKPEPKKPAQKSPYSGSKKSSAKTSKK